MKKIMLIALALSALLASAFTGSFNQILSIRSIRFSADTAAHLKLAHPPQIPKKAQSVRFPIRKDLSSVSFKLREQTWQLLPTRLPV
jgi:hypothetical protein